MVLAGQRSAAKRLWRKGILSLGHQALPVAGSIHVVVFDKTGTMTRQGMEFSAVMPIVDGHLRDPLATHVENWKWQVHPLLQQALACCHSVVRGAGADEEELIGDEIEVSLVRATRWTVPTINDPKKHYLPPIGSPIAPVDVIRSFAFDPAHLTSGVVFRDPATRNLVVVFKGAQEQVAKFSKGIPDVFGMVVQEMSAEGYYVLGVAMKTLPPDTTEADVMKMARRDLESNLTIAALLLFRNDIKSDTADAIEELRRGGIRSVMVTGDSEWTAIAVARKARMLPQNGDMRRVVCAKVIQYEDGYEGCVFVDAEHGHMIEVDKLCPDMEIVLTNEAFRNLLFSGLLPQVMPYVRVMARMSPQAKATAISQIQQLDATVMMVGDGDNDALAMRAADVSVVVCESELNLVAQFTLVEDSSLKSICELIRTGRGCLATNLATIAFFFLYGFLHTFRKLAQLFFGNAATPEWGHLTMEILVGTVFVYMMTWCEPRHVLSPDVPEFKVIDHRVLTKVFAPLLIFGVAIFIALHQLVHPSQTEFYVRWSSGDFSLPQLQWNMRGDNYEAAVINTFLYAQFASVAWAYSFGGKYRRYVLWNWPLTVCYFLAMAALIFLILGGPTPFHCLMRVNCDTKTSLEIATSAFLAFISPGKIGGCFYGPQMRSYYENTPFAKDRYDSMRDYFRSRLPMPNTTPACVPQGAIEIDPRPSEVILDGFGAPECVGPNNCFGFNFRFIMLFFVASMVVVTHAVHCTLSRRRNARKPLGL